MTWHLINFYEFLPLTDLEELRAAQRALAERLGLIGTVLLAPEGINVALGSTSEAALAEYVETVRRDPRFAAVEPKWSVGERRPFEGLVVKAKRWIIRFAEAQDPPVDAIRTGRRIDPESFHELMRRGDVVVVDTRNRYETDYGRFQGAEDLRIDRFTEFPQAFLDRFQDQKDKTFLFYCTGGVRCEKVVPWAEAQGFTESYQLDGGILAYFEQVGGDGWEGSCFVFDKRWLVGPDLSEANDDSLAIRIQPKPLTASY